LEDQIDRLLMLGCATEQQGEGSEQQQEDMASSSGVVYEGWMVRHGRRKIGRSFIHMRYFVLEPRLLSYYKRKPQHKDEAGGGKLPIKSLHIDGNCRVEDRGLNMHHGRVSSSPIRSLLFVPLFFLR
jgi:hypothetical protein